MIQYEIDIMYIYIVHFLQIRNVHKSVRVIMSKHEIIK